MRAVDCLPRSRLVVGRVLSVKVSQPHYAASYMLERLNIMYNQAVPRKKHQGPEDFAETAFSVFQKAIGEAPVEETTKNPAAVALGRLGGQKGGKARAAKLTPERRSEIAPKS